MLNCTAAAFKLETHICTLGTLDNHLDMFEGPHVVEVAVLRGEEPIKSKYLHFKSFI